MNFSRNYKFRLHAVKRMLERNIPLEAIKSVIESGEIIEKYPDDQPFPSFLILGYYQGQPIHVVVASAKFATVVITVYKPSESEWDGEFKTRKPKS